ncbi:MAG: hypothetical protein ABL962_04025 [Fimbriimonadaceae bacterium]
MSPLAGFWEPIDERRSFSLTIDNGGWAQVSSISTCVPIGFTTVVEGRMVRKEKGFDVICESWATGERESYSRGRLELTSKNTILVNHGGEQLEFRRVSNAATFLDYVGIR